MIAQDIRAYYTTSDQERMQQAAGRAARRIEDTIAWYTTPGIEAAVLRLLGVPQAPAFAARLHRWGVLGTGAAHWLAGAMIRLRAAAPANVTGRLLQDLEPADLAVPVEVAPTVLQHAVRGAFRTLEARRRARDERLALMAVGPGRRTIEVALETGAVPDDPADLVLLVGPADQETVETALRRARERANRASERAGRYIRLGWRVPAAATAYLSVVAALTGLDALVLAEEAESAEAHFARRICAQAGLLVLGAGPAGDDPARELAQALVMEQLARLAGVPATSWGWVAGHPASHAALTALFPTAFITPAGPEVSPQTTGSVSCAQVLACLETWSPLALDSTLVNKSPGYWNPFI